MRETPRDREKVRKREEKVLLSSEKTALLPFSSKTFPLRAGLSIHGKCLPRPPPPRAGDQAGIGLEKGWNGDRDGTGPGQTWPCASRHGVLVLGF